MKNTKVQTEKSQEDEMTVKEINIAFATPVPILTEKTFTKLKYSSFSRGYHVCKDVWISIIGDDALTCEREEHNENDKNTVVIISDDCVSKKIGHVALNWSKVVSSFLQFTNHYIRVEVAGKRVSRCAGLGLEIPVHFFLWRCNSHNVSEK